MDNNVDNFPPLPWHERREDTPRVDLSAPSVLGKLSSYAFQGNSFPAGKLLVGGEKTSDSSFSGLNDESLEKNEKSQC